MWPNDGVLDDSKNQQIGNIHCMLMVKKGERRRLYIVVGAKDLRTSVARIPLVIYAIGKQVV